MNNIGIQLTADTKALLDALKAVGGDMKQFAATAEKAMGKAAQGSLEYAKSLQAVAEQSKKATAEAVVAAEKMVAAQQEQVASLREQAKAVGENSAAQQRLKKAQEDAAKSQQALNALTLAAADPTAAVERVKSIQQLRQEIDNSKQAVAAQIKAEREQANERIAALSEQAKQLKANDQLTKELTESIRKQKQEVKNQRDQNIASIQASGKGDVLRIAGDIAAIENSGAAKAAKDAVAAANKELAEATKAVNAELKTGAALAGQLQKAESDLQAKTDALTAAKQRQAQADQQAAKAAQDAAAMQVKAEQQIREAARQSMIMDIQRLNNQQRMRQQQAATMSGLPASVAAAGGIENLRQQAAAASETERNLRKIPPAADSATFSISSLGDGLKTAFIGGGIAAAIITLTNSLQSMTSALIRNQVEAEKVGATFSGVLGQRGATDEIEFVRKEADRLGVSYAALATQYSRFVAASKGTELQGRASREVFSAVAESVTRFGLSVEEAEGIFRALTQMVSKGQIQAEELRGQLGERLPGAFKTFADSIGVTTGQLSKMLELGEVGPDKLIGFADTLKKGFAGSSDEFRTLGQEIARLGNAWEKFLLAVNDSGIGAAIKASVVQIRESLGGVAAFINENRAAFIALTGAIAGLAVAGSVAGAVSLLVIAIKALTAVMAANPITLALLGLTAVGGAGYAYYKSLDTNIQGLTEKLKILKNEMASGPQTTEWIAQKSKEIAEVEARIAKLKPPAAVVADVRKIDNSFAAVEKQKIEEADQAYRDLMTSASGVNSEYIKGVRLLMKQAAEGRRSDEEVARGVEVLKERYLKVNKEASAFDAILDSIRKKQAVIGQEQALGRDLTEAEKFRAEMLQQIANNADKITAAKQTELKAEVERVAKTMESVEAEKKRLAVVKEMRELREQGEREIAEYEAKSKALFDQQSLAAFDAMQSAKDQAALVRLEGQYLGANNEERVKAIEHLRLMQRIEAERERLRRMDITEEQRAELLAKYAETARLQSQTTIDQFRVDEFKRTFEEIGNALTAEIMRGGKNAGRLLKDYFKTLVLQPIIKAIVNPVAGAITGALGLGSTAAQAGQGGTLASIGSIANIGSAASAAYSAAAGGFISTLGSAATSIGSTIGSAAIAEFGLGMQGLALNSSVGALAAGAEFASIAAAAGPYVLAAAALYMVYKAMDKSGTPTRGADVYSTGTSVADPLAGTVTSAFGTDAAFQAERVAQTEAFLSPLALSSAQALNRLSALTGGVKQFAVGLQFATDGVEDTRGAIRLFADGATIAAKAQLKFSNDLSVATKEFTGELALSMIDAIKASITLPQMFADELETLRTQVGGPTIEAIAQFTDKVVALLTASKQMKDAFALLPGSFAQISGLTDELRIKLADLFGGFQNANAAIGQYYEAFYTESERAAFTTAQLTATLKTLGISTLPATREAFRALVDGQDLTTESGRKTYAALISLSGAFAQITPEIESASSSLQGMAESVGTIADRVLSAAQKVNDILLQREIDRVNAINRRADEFAGIARSLRDAIDLRVKGEEGVFRDILSKALGGDTDAMRALPEAARAAYEAQREVAASGFEAERAQQMIVNDLRRAAEMAESEAKKRAELPAVEDPLLVAMRELLTATKDLGNSIPVKLLAGFEKIDKSLDGLVDLPEFKDAFKGLATETTLAAMFTALDANGDGVISKLEALNTATTGLKPVLEAASNGTMLDKAGLYNALRETGLTDAEVRSLTESAVGPQSDAMWAALQTVAEGLKLRREAELDVSAVISLVDGQSALPAGLRDALLSGVRMINVAVSAAVNGELPIEVKRLLIDQQGQYNSVIKAALQSGLPADVLRVISDQGGEYATLVKAVLDSSLSPDVKKLALTAGGEFLTTVKAAIDASSNPAATALALKGSEAITKTVQAALGIGSAEAIALAAAVSSTITKTIDGAVSLGTLTGQQQAFLDLFQGPATKTLTLIMQAQSAAGSAGGQVQSVEEIANAAAAATEAQQYAQGDAATIAKIQSAYQAILGRPADAAGLAFYANSNFSDRQIRAAILRDYESMIRLPASWRDSSAELQLIDAYIDFFGRLPDAGGFEYWNQYIAAGGSTGSMSLPDSIAAVRRQFASEPEAARYTQLVGAYAQGGAYPGGLALVGEDGPELINFRNPGQVYTNDQSMRMMSGTDMSGVEERLERLENALYSVAKHSESTSRQLARWNDGDRMRVAIDQDLGEKILVEVKP